MWAKNLAILLFALLTSPAFGAGPMWTLPQATAPISNVVLGWHQLNGAGGAGGYITGIDIATDGTKVNRTDTYGAYWLNSSKTGCANAPAPLPGCWQQLVLATNMPSGLFGSSGNLDQGTYEIRVCNSNTNHFYMYYGPSVLSGTKSGQSISWSNTSFASLQTNGNDSNRTQGRFMACDTVTDNTLVVGTPFNGAFYTQNGGGTFNPVNTVPPSTGMSITTSSTSNTLTTSGTVTFALAETCSAGSISANNTITVYETGNHSVAALGTVSSCTASSLVMQFTQIWPASQSAHTDWTIATTSAFSGGNQNNSLIAVDPTSCTTSCSTWYATSYGNGVYKSTSGPGGPYALVSGSSADPIHMIVDQFGYVYEVDASNNLYVCNAPCSSFAQNVAAGTGEFAIAVDPASVAHSSATIVMIKPGGQLNTSIDGGVTWTGFDGCCHITYTANDIPWLAGVSTTGSPSVSDLAFDPSQSHMLFAGFGVGVMETVPNDTVSVAWNSQSGGIQQLVSNQIISPPGGSPVSAGWDFATFYVGSLTSFPSIHGCASPSGAIVAAWAVDYATSDPTKVFAICNFFGTQTTGFSTDGGQTYTAYTNYVATGLGSCVAATSATNVLFVQGDGVGPLVSTNANSASATFAAPTLPGSPSTGWPPSPVFNGVAQGCAADRVAANTLYLFNSNDIVFRSTDGGVTWTSQCNPCGLGSPFSAFYKLQAIPGVSGGLLFTGGRFDCSNCHPTTQTLMMSTNGGQNWSAITGFADVWAFGFGAKKPGSSFYSVYVYGWYNGTLGFWQSTDNLNTWTQITPSDGGWPMGVYSVMESISGDMNSYNLLYACTGGMNCFYDNFNYLLKRDLDPASNDDSPVGLDMVG